ncbi:MAG: hypothetical protein WCT29_03135 [Candidatus Paceibacterota bacterium]|jgi:hypothetical protein
MKKLLVFLPLLLVVIIPFYKASAIGGAKSLVFTLSASVSGDSITVSIPSGQLSVEAGTTCSQSGEGGGTYSDPTIAAMSATATITAGPASMVGQTIPLTYQTNTRPVGDCWSAALGTDFTGSSRTFSNIPAEDYIVKVEVTDNLDKTAIRSSSTLTIAAAPITYNVTASANAGGSVSTPSPSKVESGSTSQITVTPTSGYSTSSLVSWDPSDCATAGVFSPTSATFPNSTVYNTGAVSKDCAFTFKFNAIPVPPSCSTTHYDCSPASAVSSNNVSGLAAYTWTCSNAGTSVSCSEQKAPAVTPPGQCSDPLVLNTCNVGNFKDTADSTTQYKWDCESTNGGTTANCAIDKTSSPPPPPPPSPMSGNLTATDCTIALNADTCTSSLNWTTTNPVGTSAVTTPTNVTVGTGNNSSAIYGVEGGSPNGERTFYLYNDGTLLDQDTAKAYCDTNTEWDGTKCAAVMSGTISVPNCTIASGGSSCTSNLSWSITNPEATPTKITATGMTDITVSNSLTPSSQSGTKSVTVPYSSRIFYLYNNNKVLGSNSATASCVSGTTWDNTKCAPVAGMYGTLSGAGCEIAVNANSCTTNLSWTINSPEATPTKITASGMTPDITVSNSLTPSSQSGTQSVTVPYSSRTFYLYNNAKSLVPTSPSGSGVNIPATCVSGTVWDGAKCTPTVNPMSGTLTPSPTSCTIAKDGNSCNVNLAWSITNPQAIPTKITATGMTDITVSNSLTPSSQSGTKSVTVPYNYRTFYLYNNGEPPVTQNTVYSNCVGGTQWDGSKCAEGTVNPQLGDWEWGPCTNTVCGVGVQERVCNNPPCAELDAEGLQRECTVTNNCGGGNGGDPAPKVNGQCYKKHYLCTWAGDSATIRADETDKWTWTCPGSNGGTSVPCQEIKKKPTYQEN